MIVFLLFELNKFSLFLTFTQHKLNSLPPLLLIGLWLLLLKEYDNLSLNFRSIFFASRQGRLHLIVDQIVQRGGLMEDLGPLLSHG